MSVHPLFPLFARYRRVLVIDTETTGLNPETDSVIQFSARILCPRDGQIRQDSYTRLLKPEFGTELPDFIRRLTGLTPEILNSEGMTPEDFCREAEPLFSGNVLLAAYNAHFDLSFLYHLFSRHGNPACLQGKDKLDILTLYRDRRPGSHRLSDAVRAYGVDMEQAHRAEEDARAAWMVLEAMAREENNIERYVNLFGYSRKYGAPKRPIRSVTYRVQDGWQPLYLGEMLPPEEPPRMTLGEFQSMFGGIDDD